MKKIFTTLAAVALVATAANAAVTVTYDGQQIENGAVITLGNADFKFTHEIYTEEKDGFDFELYDWMAGYEPTVECGNPVHAYAEASLQKVQFCPNGNCIPSKQQGDVWVVDTQINNNEFRADIHLSYDTEKLPTADEYIKVTLTDDDEEPFTFTVKFVTTEMSGVNEIMAGERKVAAIYDMQGRRVRDDFRGAAIVVYDNGKAVKQIIK